MLWAMKTDIIFRSFQYHQPANMVTSLCCIIFVSFIATNHRTKNQQQPWAIAKFTSGIKNSSGSLPAISKITPVLSLLLLSEKKKDPNWRNNSGHEVRSSSPKTNKKKMWCSSEIQPGWLVGRLVDQWTTKSEEIPLAWGRKSPRELGPSSLFDTPRILTIRDSF